MEVLWLLLLTSANGGPIPSSQNGCSVRKGGSGIGIDSHLQKPAQQQCSQGHYRVRCLRATTLLTKLEMIGRRGGLLEVFRLVWSYFSSWAQIGPWGVRAEARGPKMGIGSYNVPWGLGLRPMRLGPEPHTALIDSEVKEEHICPVETKTSIQACGLEGKASVKYG